MGLRETIFAATPTFLREPADAPGWEAAAGLHVREMSVADSDDFEKSRVLIEFDAKGNPLAKSNLANIRARLLVRTLCDADGARVFADGDAEQLGKLLPRNAADRLFEQALRINRLGPRPAGVEEKNDSTPAAASPSA